ncbi:hypothetical protein BT67DRAFT_378833 [Trichocladium antarcticum]|uniref:Uncharacterized protein n=1 Tax=Trichocladium antarcticum TaxID=1450529 RepID=A0AAN6ZEI1_9PEZI|nr:hypothetical protein BT67DRAFT_378833 [Trichocladium antarcticum]
MPQDPNLYGQPPPKKQKKEIALSGSLAFTSQLSSLLATSSASAPSSATNTSRPRPRPSKPKSADTLARVKVKRKDGVSAGAETQDNKKLNLKSPIGTEESKAEREFARRKMESKARLYAAMQRGDYIGREIGLVDFDRKWAESNKNNPDGAGAGASSDSDSDSPGDDSNIDTEILEYTDEFGRLRRGTRAEKLRHERRLARGVASAAELERMSARPKAPETLIYGDAVQAEAFAAQDLDAMEALARKRDRSATPPEAVHYQADREVRTKGVGFYQFSKGGAERAEEMKGLEEERGKTEGLRRGREEKAERRKREIEERRKEIEERRREIGERKAKKMAESFLDDLGRDFGRAGDDGK